MSGRIRTIKPELLTDEVTGNLSSGAFRLFVSLILLADDQGRMRAATGLLESLVFWSPGLAREREDFARLIEELAAGGLVVRYLHGRQRYLAIAHWDRHQKVDHAAKPRIPDPYDPLSERLDDPREDLAKDSTTLAPHTSDLRPVPPTIDHRPVATPAAPPPAPSITSEVPKLEPLPGWAREQAGGQEMTTGRKIDVEGAWLTFCADGRPRTALAWGKWIAQQAVWKRASDERARDRDKVNEASAGLRRTAMASAIADVGYSPPPKLFERQADPDGVPLALAGNFLANALAALEPKDEVTP